MDLNRFVKIAGIAAVVFEFGGAFLLAAGHGGGGFSVGGGSHSGSSAAGHGGVRGYPGGPGGRSGMRGSPGIYGGSMRGRSLPPYVPPSVANKSIGGVSHSGTQSQISSPRNLSRHSLTRTTNGGTTANPAGTTGEHHPLDATLQNKASSGSRRNPRGLQNHTGFDEQTQQRLRNWQGPKVDLSTARQRHRDWCHGHHGADWWRHHCDVIIFVDSGWWGWWDGWWFPAWGYDPYYSEYAYDGPVYGYNGLPPDDAIARVQQELQRLGYYPYAVDGKLGPQTQNAINRYQRDHRLPITGTIDPATVGSLGLAR